MNIHPKQEAFVLYSHLCQAKHLHRSPPVQNTNYDILWSFLKLENLTPLTGQKQPKHSSNYFMFSSEEKKSPKSLEQHECE